MAFNDDHKVETYRSLLDISRDLIKSLVLINGGALVALLAYMGQTNHPPTTANIKCPTLLFIGGLTLAVLTGFFAYLTQLRLYGESVHNTRGKGLNHEFWLTAGFIVAALSVIFFSVGAYMSVSALGK